MKGTCKKLFSILLTLCMVLALLPGSALAARRWTPRNEPDPVPAAITNRDELCNALNKISDGSASNTGSNQVTLKKDLTLTTAINIPKNVTLIIDKNITLTVSKNEAVLKTFLSSEGTIQCNAGATLMLPGSSDSPEAFVGTDDHARVKLTKGFITLSGLSGSSALKLDGSAVAEIPAGKIAYLQIPDKDDLIKNKGIALDIASGSTLTVKGMLRIPSGDEFTEAYYPASVTVNGTLDSTDGVLSVSIKPTLKVASGGKMIIGKSGIVTNTKIEDATGQKAAKYDTQNIMLVPGGSIKVMKGSFCDNLAAIVKVEGGQMLTPSVDANGNNIFGTHSPAHVAIVTKPDGSSASYATLSDAITAANAIVAQDTSTTATISLISTPLTIDASLTISEGVTLVIPADQSLTITKNAVAFLGSAGKLEVRAGGTLTLPNSSGDPEIFVGKSDADARLQLAKGSLVFDIGQKRLTLTAASEAAVPAGKTTYLLLSADGVNKIPLNAVIETGAKLTVADTGTLKAVSGAGETGSQVTVNGTLDILGTLAVAEKAAIIVASGGTLKLPVLSKEAIDGTGDGTGLKGDLRFLSGASFRYAGQSFLGGDDPYLTLDASSQAALNMKKATLALNSGKATVVKDLKALLVTSTPVSRFTYFNSDTVRIPLHLTVAAGATLEIAAGKTLSLPNESSLTVSGSLSVMGNLEIHSTAVFAGNASVYGTTAVYGVDGLNLADGATLTLYSSGARVLSNADISAKLRSTSSYTTASNKNYTSIVDSVGSKDFPFGWEYYVYYVPVTTYYVSIDSGIAHGTVTATPRNAVRGGTVTITVKPDSGYVLGALTVTDSKGNVRTLTDKGSGKYSFTMPGSKVTVTASFYRSVDGCEYSEYCAVNQYVDLSSNAWYHEAVDYVIDLEMMSGYSSNRFGPNDTLTRAMIVQVLYNLEGQPGVSRASFTDVPRSAWYADAVSWASAKGLVDGYNGSRFGPEDPVTREQMATILFRYASYKNYNVSARADLTVFNDSGKISSWSVSALRWAVAKDLVSGRSGSMLAPAGTATRAEVATILMRFCENVVK